MREWNPLWNDREDDDNPAYLAAIRRIIVASINWIEAHPDFRPVWREINKRAAMRAAGIPDDVPEANITIAGAWEDYFTPQTSYTRAWFRTMADAGGKGKDGPSARMMGKGIAAGALLIRNGWDEFDRFMLTSTDDNTTQH